MNFKYIISLCLVCMVSIRVSAQVEKKIYQTLVINDSTKQIYFNFSDSCIITYWKQEDKIMVETFVLMGVKNEEIITNLANEGRYSIVSESRTSVNTLKFAAKRPVLKKPKGGVILENVVVHIYLPESFELKNEVAYRTATEIMMARKQ